MKKTYPIEMPVGYISSAATKDAGGDQLIDVAAVLRAVRRRIGLMIAVFTLTVAAVALINFQLTPKFSATAKVMVDTRENNVASLGSVLSTLETDASAVNTEVEVMRSRALMEKVVRKLDLVNNADFNPNLRERSMLEEMTGSVRRFLWSLAPRADGPPGPPPSPEAIERRQIERMVSRAINTTYASRVGSTYAMQVTATARNPGLAAAIANAIADQYLLEQLDAKFDATRRANAWLEERLTDIRAEVNTAESLVEAYRAQTGLFEAEGSSLTEQQISDLTAQYVVQEAELAERQARLNAVRRELADGGGAENIAEALTSAVISNLRAQQAEIIRRRAELQTRYGPRHPEILRIRNEEEDLDRQIASELRRIVSSLESEVVIARQRVDSLRTSVSNLRSQLATNNRALVRLRELERNAEASRALYESFLTRFKETNDQDGITQADARIIERAIVPDGPSSPNTILNLMLGVVMGMGLAGLMALLSELLDNYISNGTEIEENFNVPYIGSIPLLPRSGLVGSKPNPADYLVQNPLSGFAESLRNLRAAIMFADIDKAAKTVAVTSSLPDEGKTSLSFSLGRMSAMSGAKTVVIDGDFRRRQLTEVAGLEPEAGLLEYLFGEKPLESIIQTDPATGLHIVPLTDARHTPRDVFGSRSFDALLGLLRETYDLVVIDTGPILLMAETRVITGKVDQVIVGARWRKTSRHALSETLSILQDFRANIAGVVLTFVDLRRRARHAYNNSANYRAYNKYYTTG